MIWLTLLACRDAEDAPHRPPPTPTVDTGWSPSQTGWDPQVCAPYLATGARSVADARLVLLGEGRDDSLGYGSTSLTCFSAPVSPFATAIVVAAPELGDLDLGPVGWVAAFDGGTAGRHTVAEGVGARGDANEPGHFGIAAGATRDGRLVGVESQTDVAGRYDGSVRIFEAAAGFPSVRQLPAAVFPGLFDGAEVRGFALADFDNDGFEDLAVGNPEPNGRTVPGAIALYRGPFELGTTYGPETAAKIFTDTSPVNLTGAQMWLGDLDADGFVDLVHDESSREGWTGIVTVRFGPLLDGPREELLEPHVIVSPETTSEGVFTSTGDIGDLNGDGVDDLILGDVSAVDADGNPRVGAVYVWFGPLARSDLAAEGADLIVRGHATWGMLAPALVADHDGDGHNDLVVTHMVGAGAPPCPASLHVFRGPLAPGVLTLADADLAYQDDATRAAFGSALDACDLDGDGDEELVVGSYSYSSEGLPGRGRVVVFEGGPFGSDP